VNIALADRWAGIRRRRGPMAEAGSNDGESVADNPEMAVNFLSGTGDQETITHHCAHRDRTVSLKHD
jgi:hypothetical protein